MAAQFDQLYINFLYNYNFVIIYEYDYNNNNNNMKIRNSSYLDRNSSSIWNEL